jgi:hypothetical protein
VGGLGEDQSGAIVRTYSVNHREWLFEACISRVCLCAELQLFTPSCQTRLFDRNEIVCDAIRRREVSGFAWSYFFTNRLRGNLEIAMHFGPLRYPECLG